MRTHFRTASLALVIAAAAGTASAQTVITTEPVQRETVVTTRPLSLTPAQRTTVYRTIVPQKNGRAPIVHERVVTETVGRPPAVATERVVRPAPQVQYVIGDRVPAGVELEAVPETLAVDVPSVRGYKYMTINGRLLLVDPVTSTVVAEVQD